MKIICSWCKKFLGEKEPSNDPSETHAKCVNCLEKQKRTEAPLKKVVDGQRECIEEGLKGFLTISGKESKNLNFGEMIISGKKCNCISQTREELESYLNNLPGDEVDMTSLHSTIVAIPSSAKGRRRKGVPDEEEKPTEEVTYNFTTRVPKAPVLTCYDFEKERMKEVTELLAEMAFSAYLKERGGQVS